MPRIAHCDFKEGGCDDGRCKIGACVLEGLERARAEMDAVAERRRLADPENSELQDELSRLRRQIAEKQTKIAHLKWARGE
jgi:uncharacterized protein (DUF3084 family)